MITNSWIALRKQNWSRLEQLAQEAETLGLKKMPSSDLRELGLLYRQAAADLSAARTDEGARTLEGYLNRLVGRAHNFVYSGRRLSPASIWRFMAYEYPRIFRRLLPYTATAFALFVAGAVLGAILMQVRPETMEAMLGPKMIDTIRHHKMWTDSILGIEPQASSQIMTNNITVCFMTFASGIAGGLGSIFFMVENGFLIGVIAVACAENGMGLNLWGFVAAHGALELPSIFIAGGAGLRLGVGLLFPGYLRRGDSFAEGGREAIRLLSATVPLLVVAGTLEGFLSPSHAPMLLKFSVSAVLLSALVVWLAEGWRTRPVALRAG
jgi:uncharacterized membrane protein SpoIIM required for sporulation